LKARTIVGGLSCIWKWFVVKSLPRTITLKLQRFTHSRCSSIRSIRQKRWLLWCLNRISKIILHQFIILDRTFNHLTWWFVGKNRLKAVVIAICVSCGWWSNRYSNKFIWWHWPLVWIL
jgi:hypothetical protein